jgi:hypothetical protein
MVAPAVLAAASVLAQQQEQSTFPTTQVFLAQLEEPVAMVLQEALVEMVAA